MTNSETIKDFTDKVTEVFHGGDPDHNLYIDVGQELQLLGGPEDNQEAVEVILRNGVATLGEILLSQTGQVVLLNLDKVLTDPESGRYPDTQKRVGEFKFKLQETIISTGAPIISLLKTLPQKYYS